MSIGSLSSECSFLGRILIMQIGLIDLGRMGTIMVKRLLKGGHKCVNYVSPMCLLPCEKGAL